MNEPWLGLEVALVMEGTFFMALQRRQYIYATTRLVIPPTTPTTMPAIKAMSTSLPEGGLEEEGGGNGESVEGVGAPSSSGDSGGDAGDGDKSGVCGSTLLRPSLTVVSLSSSA